MADTIYPLIQIVMGLIFGSGIIGLLMKIQYAIGQVVTRLDNLEDLVQDHESRLRSFESRAKEKRNAA